MKNIFNYQKLVPVYLAIFLLIIFGIIAILGISLNNELITGLGWGGLLSMIILGVFSKGNKE